AQDGAEIQQVVLQISAAVFGNYGIHRIDGSGIGMVQPRPKHTEPAQLATVLVRDSIVRVVAPRAGVAEWPDDIAGNPQAGERPIGSVGAFGLRSEHLVQNMLRKRMLLSARIAPGYARGDRQVLAAKTNDVILRSVVPEGVECLAADDIGGRAKLRMLRRI